MNWQIDTCQLLKYYKCTDNMTISEGQSLFTDAHHFYRQITSHIREYATKPWLASFTNIETHHTQTCYVTAILRTDPYTRSATQTYPPGTQVWARTTKQTAFVSVKINNTRGAKLTEQQKELSHSRWSPLKRINCVGQTAAQTACSKRCRLRA